MAHYFTLTNTKKRVEKPIHYCPFEQAYIDA